MDNPYYDPYSKYLKDQKYEDEDAGYNSGGEGEEEGCGFAMDSWQYYYYNS